VNSAVPGELDPPVVVEPSKPATAAVVWLHGLGADGHDFEPVAAELGRAGLDDVRYVFPHAPVRPVTVNGGMAMRAWYDIAESELDRRADEEGVRASAGIARMLVDEQIARGPARARRRHRLRGLAGCAGFGGERLRWRTGRHAYGRAGRAPLGSALRDWDE